MAAKKRPMQIFENKIQWLLSCLCVFDNAFIILFYFLYFYFLISYPDVSCKWVFVHPVLYKNPQCLKHTIEVDDIWKIRFDKYTKAIIQTSSSLIL